MAKGPQFVKYFNPVLEALQQLGGSGRPAEVKDVIVETLKLSDKEIEDTIESGGTKFSKYVDWARFYLAKAGYIDSSKYGVWTLSKIGENANLSPDEAYQLFKEIHQQFDGKKQDGNKTLEEEDELEEQQIRLEDYRVSALEILKNLTPGGFEKFSQRLLRDSGFEKVTVTGKSGDGGIDGIGILQVNHFVTFKVLFQSKRYSGSISPSIIRDFRGAMMGRADKGIVITTGTFTKEAQKEAARDGAYPIELIDGEKLIDLMQSLELGLKPLITYEVDREFFEEFE